MTAAHSVRTDAAGAEHSLSEKKMRDNEPRERWVLGFDGGCAACSSIARRVEGLLDGRITARSLREPQVEAWRRDALGPNPPWAPTLLQVDNDRVRGWTGWRMSVRLARLLGPTQAWRVLGAIGDASLRPSAPVDPDRRRLLTSLGRAAVGLLVASGIKLPNAATAAAAGPVTAETVLEPDRTNMIERAKADTRYKRLFDSLSKSGFAPTSDPVVLRAKEEDQSLVRTVVVAEFAAANGRRTASLGFGVDADGTTWSTAILRAEGKPTSALAVATDGRVQTLQASSVQVQTNSSLSCYICQGLCGGLCVLGCGAAAFLLCGGNWLCLILVGFICGAVCVGGACQYGCSALGYCP